jgi:ABC-type branched-subunit amino acid transport system substrate-binding protein
MFTSKRVKTLFGILDAVWLRTRVYIHRLIWTAPNSDTPLIGRHGPTSALKTLLPITACILLALHCPPCRAENANSPDFKVGFILSLSGTWAEYGIAQRNALDLARLDYPDKFRSIDFSYEDCGLQGIAAVSAFNKLRSVNNVNLMYVWGVEPSLIVAPLAESLKVPLIAAAQAAPPAIGRKYVIRSMNYSEQYSRKLLDYFRKEQITRIGIIQADMSFYNLLVEGLIKNKIPAETIDVIGSIPPSVSDFRSIIARIKAHPYQSIGVYLTPPQILEFYREAQELHLSVKTFGATPFQSGSLAAKAGGLLEGAVYVHNLVTDDFRTRYAARYGNDEQLPWAANAYDMALLLADLFGHLREPLDSDEIIAKLSSVTERVGVGGRYIFRDVPGIGKYFEYPLAVFRISGGKHEIVLQ